ncbi:MAG: DUF4270 domain-containing protein [Bacteroidetes bacterium]|nr:DUF4270 domain-containing protein [Bacteroidota bacterium]
MNSKYLRNLPAPVLLIFLITFLFACKKDPIPVGLDLLPAKDTLNIKTTDTATLVAYSVLQDSVRTDETTLSMIGSLMDPVFGSTTAGTYMQYRLSAESPDFGTNPKLDSVVLLIPYGTFYGDTNSIQSLKVYELNDDIYTDSIYYSNHTVQTSGIPLADYSFKPARYDSLTIGGVKTVPHIRINLSTLTNYFGNKLLYAPSSALSTSADFIGFMKGLYISSAKAPSGGALMSYDPTSSPSKIVMYFHNDTEDSLHFDFVGNTLCARFSHFDHNQYRDAEPDLKRQVIQKDTTLGKSTLYVQGLGGMRIRLRLPYLAAFGNSGKVAINSAILTIKNAQTDTTFAPPPSLTLVAVDTAGHVGFLIDENEGTSYFGGAYNPYSRTYIFRITRHMQAIIDGKGTNYDLFLMANDPSVNILVPNRITITGTNPTLPGLSSDRIKLEVIYTKLH